MNSSLAESGHRCTRTSRLIAVHVATLAVLFATSIDSFAQAQAVLRSVVSYNRAQTAPSNMLKLQGIALPQANASGVRPRGSGFDAVLYMSDVFGVGYVGIKADLVSVAGPFTSTRELTVRMTPVDQQLPASRCITIDMPVSLEQGKARATVERAFPKWTLGNSFRIEILEDGSPLEGYTASIGQPFTNYVGLGPGSVLPQEHAANVLFVDTEPQSKVDLQTLGISDLGEFSVWKSISLNELPTDWRLLRDIDCMVIRQDALITNASKNEATADTHASRRRAIDDWLMMGGVLVLLDSTRDADISDGLGVRTSESKPFSDVLQHTVSVVGGNARSAVQNLNAFWDHQPDGNNGATASGTNAFSSSVGVPRTPNAEDVDAVKKTLSEFEREVKQFQLNWIGREGRLAGLGKVIRLPDKQIDSHYSLEILDSLIGYQRSTMLKRGVDPMMGDVRTRRWLIPGVAEPPVYTFIGILTLFVLLVGPIAYRWTTRGHRSHLMFLIAPVLAVITTVTMFAYSFVSDGFGTTVRTRQLTWVDGASGDAYERTRSTLFAGISPRTGLVFPAKSELMVYPNGGRTPWRSLTSQIREVRLKATIDEDGQRFDSSLLPSRTQSQFVTHDVRRNLGTVALQGLAPFNTSVDLQNLMTVDVVSTLPFELRDLVIRSHDGRYWSAKSVPANQLAEATWVRKDQDSSKLLGDLYNRFRPIGAVGQTGSPRDPDEIRDLVIFMNRQIAQGGASSTDGLFESWLNEFLNIKGDLPPGMFIATSAPSPDSVPVAQAEQVESVRYVMGTLK